MKLWCWFESINSIVKVIRKNIILMEKMFWLFSFLEKYKSLPFQSSPLLKLCFDQINFLFQLKNNFDFDRNRMWACRVCSTVLNELSGFIILDFQFVLVWEGRGGLDTCVSERGCIHGWVCKTCKTGVGQLWRFWRQVALLESHCWNKLKSKGKNYAAFRRRKLKRVVFDDDSLIDVEHFVVVVKTDNRLHKIKCILYLFCLGYHPLVVTLAGLLQLSLICH